MFFEEKYKNMPENNKEEFLKILFMNDPTEYGQSVRQEY